MPVTTVPRLADPDNVWLRHLRRTDAQAPHRLAFRSLDELVVCPVGLAALMCGPTLTRTGDRDLSIDAGLRVTPGKGTQYIAPRTITGDLTVELDAVLHHDDSATSAFFDATFGAILRWVSAAEMLVAYATVEKGTAGGDVGTQITLLIGYWGELAGFTELDTATIPAPSLEDGTALRCTAAITGNSAAIAITNATTGAPITDLSTSLAATKFGVAPGGGAASGLAGGLLWHNDADFGHLRLVKSTVTAPGDDPDAWEIRPGVAFAPEPIDGVDSINADDGWTAAQATIPLSDDGEFVLTLPNTELNRRRFDLRTDGDYRPGEEWIEVYRAPGDVPNDVLTVITPHSWGFDGGQLKVTGYDLPGFLNRTRASVMDAWWHAPRDVFDHYTRVEGAVALTDFRAYTDDPAGADAPDGWELGRYYTGAGAGFGAGSGSTDPDGAGYHLSVAHSGTLDVSREIPGTPVDDWEATASVTVRNIKPATSSARGHQLGLYVEMPGGRIQDVGAPYTVSTIDVYVTLNGDHRGEVVFLSFGGSYGATGKIPLDDGLQRLTFSIVARGEWLMCFVNGRLIGSPQRRWLPVRGPSFGAVPTPPSAMGVFAWDNGLSTDPSQLDVYVEEARMVGRFPFGLRGADRGDYHLPGAPTPGGLRGRYFDANAVANRYADLPSYAAVPVLHNDWRHLAVPYNDDPTAQRLDATIAAPNSHPSNVPATRWAARWTGSIHLDFDAIDADESPAVRIVGPNGLTDWGRLFIGRTRWRDALQDSLTDDKPEPTVNLLETFADLSHWTLLAPSAANLAGGRLTPTANSSNGGFTMFRNGYASKASRLTRKLTTLAALGAINEGIIIKQVDSDDFLLIHRTAGTSTTGDGANRLQLWRSVAGAFGQITGADAPALATNKDYWFRVTIAGNRVQVEWFNVEPAAARAATDKAPAASFTYDLAGDDAVRFGQGVAGGVGIRSGGGASTYLPTSDVLVEDLDNPAPVNLRAHLGPDARTGWYPIVVEYLTDTQPVGITLQAATLDAAGAPGAWATVPSAQLSPYGCYEEQVRRDNARDQLGDIVESFGHQWRLEPRTLEEGEFPGQVIPRVRIGRDTDLEVGSDNTEVGASGDTRDTVDRLLLDAAGLAENQGVTQLTAELVNADVGRNHLCLVTDYESLAEVSEEAMIRQRGATILGLRSTANEQVGVRPPGTRELVDNFPLTGELARMDWRPGDGVLLALGKVGVRDDVPRQLARVVWTMQREGGFGVPSVGFRQRQRNAKTALRRMFRAQANAQRNYQGQLAQYTSPLAATGDVLYPPQAIIALPASLEQVVDLELVVLVKADASIALPSIHGGPLESWGISRPTPGLSLMDYLKAHAQAGGPDLPYFQIAFPAGGAQTLTGAINYLLRLTVRI